MNPRVYEMVRNAAIGSADGRYRYWLSRDGIGTIDEPSPSWCVFIMLNPSTATADQNDPTIRRCIGFARREGATHLGVVNLWAARATRPDDLLQVDDLHEFVNASYLRAAIELADVVVAAWGGTADRIARAHATAIRPSVERIAAHVGHDLWCLGTTKAGAPRHPLYVRADQPLVAYRP